MQIQMVTLAEINFIDIAEFDQHLDTSQAKKAILPRNKSKRISMHSMIRKPLSKNPSMNSSLVAGLKANFTHNKRLKTFQISGINFSKSTWKSVTDTISVSINLGTIAINK